MPTVTIREVAKEAGVSTATVSYILTGAERYSYRPATIAKVREAAERLGYEANGAARLLRRKSTNLIGLAFNIQKGYLSPLVQTAYTETLGAGYEPVILDVSRLLHDSSDSSFINMSMLSGILSIDSQITDSIPDVYKSLLQRAPLVALYPVCSKEIDYVTTDRTAQVTIAAQHLHELGHRRIAYATPALMGIPADVKTDMRLEGWKKALHNFNIEPYAPLFLPRVELVSEMAEHIVDQILALRPRPTAVINSGEDIALAMISVLQRRGFRVPEDFSVIGAGFSSAGMFSFPTLSTVATPAAEIVQLAVKHLVERLDASRDAAATQTQSGRARQAKAQPYRRLVTPILVARESTAPPPEAV